MSHELSDEARSVIRAAVAEEFRPGRAHRERLRRGLLVRAAAGSAVTLLGSSVAKASAKSLLSTVAASLGLGFGAGLVIAGSAQLALNPSPPQVSDARASAASSSSMLGRKRPAIAPTPTLAPDLPVSDPSASQASARGTAATNAPLVAPKARGGESAANGVANSGSGSPLRAELDLMAQVQEALRDARGARALELIARYDAQHPIGALETERLAAEVFAACQTGDAVRARRAAQRFLARDQRSALAERVKKACSSENSDPR